MPVNLSADEKSQLRHLEDVKRHPWHTGMWVRRVCRALAEKGLAERDTERTYEWYVITKAGSALAAELWPEW